MPTLANVLLVLVDQQPLSPRENDLFAALTSESRPLDQRYLIAVLLLRVARRAVTGGASGAPNE